MEEFASELGEPIDSIETQICFMMEDANAYWINSDRYDTWVEFIEAKTPREAAQIFYQEYTMPMPNNGHMEMVGTFAEEFYEQYAS